GALPGRVRRPAQEAAPRHRARVRAPQRRARTGPIRPVPPGAERVTRTLVGMDDPTAQTPQRSAAPQARPDLSHLHVAVIGAGNMGGPVVRTFLAAGVRPETLCIANSGPASSERAA